MHDPEYVLVVTLDEASTQTRWGEKRTAGWTAAPTAGEVVRRVAPLLGLRPEAAPGVAESGGSGALQTVASR
jgi:cell division protein FtsI (penicillin-binding protein 3)